MHHPRNPCCWELVLSGICSLEFARPPSMAPASPPAVHSLCPQPGGLFAVSQRALWVVLVPFSNWGEHGESFRNSASGNRRQHLAMSLSFPWSGGDTEAGVCSASPGRKYAESGAGRPAPRSLSQHFRPRSAPVTVSSCAGFLVGAHLAPFMIDRCKRRGQRSAPCSLVVTETRLLEGAVGCGLRCWSRFSS